MADRIKWTCEACDSTNTVEAGQPAVCPYCRLTYDVRIETHDPSPDENESPAIAAAGSLLKMEPDETDR